MPSTTLLLADWGGNQMLEKVIRTQHTYLGLHITDPGNTGDLSTEFNGGGYNRKLMAWTPSSNKTIATTNAQIFHDLPAGTLRYLGFWDAVTFGHCIARILLPTPVSISTSGTFTALAGDIALTL